MGRRDDEAFLPWYVADSVSWVRLSLAARGAAEGIARKMGPKKDRLRVRKGNLPGLALLLRCSEDELVTAMAELLAPGPKGEHPRLIWEDDHLFDPEAAERRRRTSADRMADKRARDRQVAQASPGDACDARDVTPVSCDACDAPSPLSLSSDLGSLDPPDQSSPADVRPSARVCPPESGVVVAVPASPPRAPMPEWVIDRIGAAALPYCVDIAELEPPAAIWGTYVNDRTAEGRALSDPDFSAFAHRWIGIWVRRRSQDIAKAAESRERREVAERHAERPAPYHEVVRTERRTAAPPKLIDPGEAAASLRELFGSAPSESRAREAAER